MNEIKHLVIYTTTNCNLACKYCYFFNDKKLVPDKNKIIKKIDFFLNNLSYPDRKITFLGGEPLIYWDFLKDIINYIRLKGKNIPVSLFSNGTLLNEKNFSFFKKNNIKLILSVDGTKEDNDKFRKYKNSSLSVYDKVFSNLVYIDKENISVNMVITPETVGNLFKNILFLYKKGFRSIGWNIDYSGKWTNNHLIMLKKEILKLKIHYINLIRKREDLYEFSNCYEMIDYLIYNEKSACSNLILLPDGNFYICDKISACNSEKILKKFRLDMNNKEKAFRKREDFFRKLEKKGLNSRQLICPVGVYVYYKFVKCFKKEKLEKAIYSTLKLINFYEKEKQNLIKELIKYPEFRAIHNER